MKNINGFWLPSQDTYFVNKPNYESELTRRSLENVKSFRTAIDGGTHCGYWTQRLSENFNKVVSFEPIAEHFGCLEKKYTKLQKRQTDKSGCIKRSQSS